MIVTSAIVKKLAIAPNKTSAMKIAVVQTIMIIWKKTNVNVAVVKAWKKKVWQTRTLSNY